MSKENQKNKGVVTGIDKLSPYGKFHMTYLSYDFKRISTGKVYSKGDFWDRFTGLATGLHLDPKHPEAPTGFILFLRPEDD